MGGFIFTGILLVIGIVSLFQTRFDLTFYVATILVIKILCEKLGISLGDIAKNTTLVLLPLGIVLICSIAKTKINSPKSETSEAKTTTPSSKGQG